jgi:LPXTG-site transpeptidase (sortase) family protein
LWLLSPLLVVSYLAAGPGLDPVPHEPPKPIRVRPSAQLAPDPDIAARVAELVRPSQSVLYDPSEHRPPVAPARLTIAGIGVDEAPVVEVGVQATGEMEIPGATEVGWYQYGVSPGEAGAAVMAAHIAFDGRTGVFRDLSSVSVGDEILVEMADGRRLGFIVTETAQFSKEDLPLDRIFAKGGQPVLVLITCGGNFNRELRDYSDNVVAFAVPVT